MKAETSSSTSSCSQIPDVPAEVTLMYAEADSQSAEHYNRLAELDQRTVMEFLQRFHSEHGITPPAAVVRHQLRQQGPAGYWNSQYLKQLFPPNGLSSASGMAGLPKAPGDGCV